MSQSEPAARGSMRVFVIGIISTILVVGLALVMFAITRAVSPTVGPVDALANSDNACVGCHRNSTPGIVEQFGHSTMAAASVKCEDCHVVSDAYPGAEAHEGTFILDT